MKEFYSVEKYNRNGAGDIECIRWFESHEDAMECGIAALHELTENELKSKIVTVCTYCADCETVSEWEECFAADPLLPDEVEEVFERVAYIEQTASAMYDGGWRASDREQLAYEFHLHPDALSKICGFLETFEEADSAEEEEG